MGYPGFIAFAAVFHLLVISVQSDLIGGGLSPIFSPVFGDACRNVQCGRGRCKTSANSTFPYECECDSGWLQSPLSNSLQFDLKFLPCTFPNCTMNSACGIAPPPIEEKTNRANVSFIDPCFWVDCGGGTCNQTSIFTHNCTCFEGYYNLFNVSSFPCYQQCDIELSCSDLGIGLNNHSPPPPSSLNQNSGENQAAATLTQGNSHWTLGLMLLLFFMLLNADVKI